MNEKKQKSSIVTGLYLEDFRSLLTFMFVSNPMVSSVKGAVKSKL